MEKETKKNNDENSKKANEIIKQIKIGNRIKYYYKEKENDKKEPPDYIPFLVIKNREEDMGQRPLDNPNWHPESIKVEKFVAGGIGEEVAQPQVGQPYQVRVQVHNLGLAPSYGTFVEFYWIYASPSIPFSDRLHKIGDTKFVSIQGQNSTFVRSNQWIPEYYNEGHECIIVRAYDPLLDPMDLTIYSQVNDRHVGQRNVTVIQTSPGRNVLSAIYTWGANPKNQEYYLTTRRMGENELKLAAKSLGLKDVKIGNKPLYLGLITRFSLPELDLKVEGFELKKRIISFELHFEKKDKLIYPLPDQVDSRFRRAIQPTFKQKYEKDHIEKIWLVQGIPNNAKKGEIFGMVVSQWQGKELIGKIHQIAIVN